MLSCYFSVMFVPFMATAHVVQVVTCRSKSPCIAPDHFGDVHTRQVAWKQQAEAKLVAARAEQQQAELAECTFTPTKVRSLGL